MKVRDGYKMTEFDEIPLEWEVVNIFKYLSILNGFPFDSKNFNEDSIGMPLIRIRNLMISKVETYFKGKYDDKYIINSGDILIGMDGEFYVVKWKNINALLNQRICKIISNDHCLNEDYLFYRIKDEIKKINDNTPSTTVKHLSVNDIKKITIPLPPVLEQQRIAEILSTNDALISKTDELIEKTKEIKQGLMQELLTKGIGHTEFKDSELGRIPKDWEAYCAGKIFGNISIKNYPNERILTVTQDRGTIYRDDCGINIKTENSNLKSFKLVQKGNFIISLRSFQGGIEYTNLRGIVSPAYTVLNNIKSINEKFFKYFYKSEKFITILDSAVIGIRDGKQISYGVFKNLKIPYPPLEEQQEIASILSSIDNKLEALSNRKQKLQQIKQGLMQDLLTGRVRVNLN